MMVILQKKFHRLYFPQQILKHNGQILGLELHHTDLKISA